jgi:hypothetical protein
MGLKSWAGWRNLIAGNRTLAAVLVTVLTLLLIGGVVATTTLLACAPANQLKLKVSRCAANNIAARQTPIPTINFPSPRQSQPPPSAPASPYVPPTNPPTAFPPVPTPASAMPPQDPFYPGGSQTPFASSLSCSLPVYVGPPGSGGFVTLPGSSFVADPRSAVALPPPIPGEPTPPAGPGYGQPSYGMTYDRANSRWLPVGPSLVAPDGNHYVYPTSEGIYLVTSTTNAQIELGAGHAWSVVRVLNDHVLATIPNSPGFWVVPFAGTPQQVTATGYWQTASATAAYGTATSAVPLGVAQKLLKLDIGTGQVTDWFSDSGISTFVLGFDRSGDPIIETSYNGGAWVLWLTTSPTSATVIANSSESISPQGAPVADSHGVWIPFNSQTANGPGLVLYVRGSGLYWMANLGVQLAGGCD